MTKHADFSIWSAENIKEWVIECLKERGRVLTGEHSHYCGDWDGLTMDETCEEWPSCLDCRPYKKQKEKKT